MLRQDKPQQTKNIFVTRALTKSYGEGAAAVHALRGVHLEIPAGEMVVLLGASGSGKSTLLNIIGELDRETTGTVYFQDQELSAMSAPTTSRHNCQAANSNAWPSPEPSPNNRPCYSVMSQPGLSIVIPGVPC